MVVFGGAPVPVPLTSLEGAYGLEDDIDLQAGIYPTSMLFSPGNGSSPIFGMSLGGAWHPIPRHRTALTIGATVYGFSNRLDAVLFGDAWLAGDIRATQWLSLAAGLHNTLRFATTDPAVSERPFWSPTAFAQVAFGPIGRWEFQIEGRWYSFTENGYRAAPKFVPIGELGALGVLLGVSYTFPGGR
jgi:hypothetical protein